MNVLMPKMGISMKTVIDIVIWGLVGVAVLLLVITIRIHSIRERNLVREVVSSQDCTLDDYQDLSRIGGENHKELALKISGHVPLTANMVVTCTEGNHFVFLEREFVKQADSYQNIYTLKGNF